MAAFALLMGMALPLAAQSSPTKFIPTFLVYYGGGPALVTSDAAKLAKFDLIEFDRFRYNSIGSGTWAEIKSINPDAQIYLYQMGPETPSHLDSISQLYLNGLGRHDISRGHSQGSLNGDNPGLFQLDASGKRIYSRGLSNVRANQYWYLMDFGSAAYHSYWTNAVKADIVDQAWRADGIFVDKCLVLPNSGGYSERAPWYSTNASWAGAMNSFANAITAGMHAFNQKLWCNRGDTRTADGSAAWQALDNSASPPDVVLEEGAFAVQWGKAHTNFYSETEWKRQIDTMGAIRNSSVAMLSHTKLMDGQTGVDNLGKPVTYGQTLWYALGSFLLAKNDTLDNSYFMFSGGSGYNRIWWHEEYEKIDLGKAVGAYSVTKAGSVNVYWREFEKGYVFVNPTGNNAASVTLPQASRQLTRTNLSSAVDSIPRVTSIALPGYHAAILLKAPSDTEAPSVPGGLTGTAVSNTQINLSWNASTDNVGVQGYYVYLNDTALGTTTTPSFQHTGLVAGTTYNYRVSAYDAVPNHSAWTATPVSVTTTGTAATSGSGTVQFSCYFPTAPNNCSFTEQAKVSGRASIVNFGREGGTAVRLHTEPGDNNVASSGDMERNDLWLSQQASDGYQGREHWWAHSMLFPDDFAMPTWQMYVVQNFHNSDPGPWQANFHLNFAPGADTTKPGNLIMRGHGGINSGDGRFGAIIGQVQKNVWYDFVYHVKWSSGTDGFFDAWVNGVKMLSHRGPTLYSGQGVYLKLANYHTPVCNPYPDCTGPASSIIHDRVIRGSSALAVSAGPLEGELILVDGVLTPVQS
ncbi:MAG TPA: heparin lyase I family protein [Burkholderiales bacterium]|nr:heparin lyase I family protein [Burkholderiales bacterium]